MNNITHKPIISIIMAAYNAEKTIHEAISSVLSQSFLDWELLVVNDCSTDNTALIVCSFSDSRIHLINNDVNSGVSISRKKALDYASGEWIAILDSDDAWVPEKLTTQIQFAKQTDAELVFTGSSFMDENGSPIDWQLHVPSTLVYRKLLKQNLISNSSVLVKAYLYRKFYAVGDNMHEDFALWLRITKEGITAYGIDSPLLIYRISSFSKSSNKLKAAKMNWNTYRYIGLNPIISAYYMVWYIIKGLLKYRHLKLL